ncbi:unnamed protein product [Durusdinium trenchii]|uniref:Uncharacterized protein n=1 Tax=Durusdinium trenchii TaxID=1381693 RepID=A0ABP0MTH2_9DINO
MAFVAPAVLGHGGRAFQATPPPPAGRPAAPPLENGVEFRIKGSSTLSMFLCAAVVATGAQRSGILRRSRARILRRGTGSAATSGSCCRKSQCLHPDKPAMFACADCPRRTSKSASEEGLDSQPVAVAAFIGEEVATKACGRKSQCLHPDKPAMFACADCPRRTSKSASEEGLDSQPVAVAAFIGEEVATKACGRKSQCLHPDKPAMFACADCPRRMSKTALEIEGC